MKNFPFEYNGLTLWYSRSVAVCTCVFCKDSDGNWCVLINLRGPGAPSQVGKWCIPSGYLDFDEDLCQCGIRETYEETGVFIPRVLMNFHAINSIPNSGSQNIQIYYYAVLPGIIDEYTLTTEHSEKNEVSDIMFMPVSMILTSNIDLGFNNGNIILDIYNKYIVKGNGNLIS